MTRERKLVLGIIAVVVIVVIGGFGVYNFMFGATDEASAPISSIPLDVATNPPPEPTETATAVPSPVPTEIEATEEIVEEEAPSATPEPTSTPEATATTEPTATPEPVLRIFEISQEESEVRFTLGELLLGLPNTVVGVTDQVAGQIAVDFEQPAATQLGVILINARTLATDDRFRNDSIRTRILETDDYEFITFTPTALEELPEEIEFGQSIEFQVIGDLLIREVTQPVTFTVSLTPVSETELMGVGTTTVNRADFDLVIPQVDGVADVDEAVLLEIEFVATAVEP